MVAAVECDRWIISLCKHRSLQFQVAVLFEPSVLQEFMPLEVIKGLKIEVAVAANSPFLKGYWESR